MTAQPEALRLADELDGIVEDGADPDLIYEAAAELRRLHAENERIRSALNGWIRENSPGGWIDDLRTQRDALLEALTNALPQLVGPRREEARAAIKAAEGEKT